MYSGAVRSTLGRMRHTFKRARSSITGRWVKLKYAIRHPRTTTVETVKAEQPVEPPEHTVESDTP